MALNSKYEGIKKEILRTEPLPSTEVAHAILRQEDARSNVLQTEYPNQQGIGAGLAVTQPWQHQNRGGGSSGSSRNWSKRLEEGKLKLSCSHRGKKKHTRETCFELHGYLEWWQERKSKNN